MKKLLILPDRHTPYHDKKCMNVVFKVARALNPDICIDLGDGMDCAEISFHDRGPDRIKSFVEEVREERAIVKQLSRYVGPDRKRHEGNHERRLIRYVMKNAPALIELMPTIPELLKLKEAGWTWYKYGVPAKTGKLYTVHDAGYHGKNAVRSTKDQYQHNVVIGHCHRGLVEYDGNIVGEKHVGMSLGWLGDEKSVVTDYLKPSEKKHAWMHSIGWGYVNAKGDVHLNLVPIIGGEAYVEGKCFRG